LELKGKLAAVVELFQVFSYTVKGFDGRVRATVLLL